jgi:hypothetical protein
MRLHCNCIAAWIRAGFEVVGFQGFSIILDMARRLL